MAISPEQIWKSSQLPTLPSVAVDLLECSKNPELDISDVVNIIKTDPAISAKILKATNSAYFGLRAKVTTVERAVPLLGTTVVTSLALSFSLSQAAVSDGELAEHFQNYWMQSVVQAVTAELLTKKTNQGLAPEYFLTGLLTDLGRLAMLKAIPEPYEEVLKSINETPAALHRAELDQLGIDHVSVGIKLMEEWSLPPGLIQAIKTHHLPVEELLELIDDETDPLVKATAFSAACGDYFCSSNPGEALQRLQIFGEKFYDLTGDEFTTFLEEIRERVEEASELFSVNLSQMPDLADLLLQANEQLAEIAMREHAASTQALARQQVIEKEKDELITDNAQLRKQVIHDPLTKVYNRAFLDESLGKEIHRCRRAACTVGAIFLDIDHFKKLNDTYGHPFGDEVLVKVATALQGCLRKSDMLARYGGEEFVIIAIEPSEPGLKKLAERVRATIESLELRFGAQPVPVTVSVGAALTIPGRSDDGVQKALLSTADGAMYESKQSGRNRVTIQSMLSPAERRLAEKVTGSRFSRWLVLGKIVDIPTISVALANLESHRKLSGDLAVEFGYLTPEQVELIIKDQFNSGERFGQIAMRLNYFGESELLHILTFQQENPHHLAALLVKSGAFSPDQAREKLQAYFKKLMPEHTPSLVNQ